LSSRCVMQPGEERDAGSLLSLRFSPLHLGFCWHGKVYSLPSQPYYTCSYRVIQYIWMSAEQVDACMQPKKRGKEDQHGRAHAAVCCVWSMARTIRDDPPQLDRWWCSMRWPENDELGAPTGFGRRWGMIMAGWVIGYDALAASSPTTTGGCVPFSTKPLCCAHVQYGS
jgi:hypothetical protein